MNNEYLTTAVELHLTVPLKLNWVAKCSGNMVDWSNTNRSLKVNTAKFHVEIKKLLPLFSKGREENISLFI